MKTYKITSSYYNDNKFHFYHWDDLKQWPIFDVVAEHEVEIVEAETLDDAYIQFISSHADCFNEKGKNVLWVGGVSRLNVSREHSEFMMCAIPGYYFETDCGKPDSLADINRILVKQAEDRKAVIAKQEKERKEEQERIRKEKQDRRDAMKFTIGSMIDFSTLGL